jgi:hypothetical protein
MVNRHLVPRPDGEEDRVGAPGVLGQPGAGDVLVGRDHRLAVRVVAGHDPANAPVAEIGVHRSSLVGSGVSRG